MVFGFFFQDSVRHIRYAYIKVIAARYKNLLEEHVPPVLQNFEFENNVFMQDNAPWHKAIQFIAYLNDEEINIIHWLAQSLDKFHGRL